MQNALQYLAYKAYKLRQNSIKATTAAGSGHPTSCLSAADIMAVIFFNAFQFDNTNPHNRDNDRFILSKGHAAPLLYAAWHERGVLTEKELLSLRKFNSVLEGHPTPRFAYIEAATGSLGMGVSIGVGIALNAKKEKRSNYTYVLMGDSEMAEGSVWEAMELAWYYKLDHLIGIIDVNRLGQSTQTMEGYDLESYRAKCEAFGWRAFVVDGHDIEQLVDVVNHARQPHAGKPSMIIAKTIKGYGVASIEGKEGYHGKVFSKQELQSVLHELEQRFSNVAKQQYSLKQLSVTIENHKPEIIDIAQPQPNFKKGESIATRKAYGSAVTMVGAEVPGVMCLDAEVKNSTFAETFENAFPDRFIQCFIAEQTMVGMGIGLASQGKIPYLSTFGAFFSRAHDQIRMAAISQLALRLVGSHAGVSIGEDGPSQMALEDIAIMRSLPGSVVLYPSDAVATTKLVARMAQYTEGISYLRTTRAATPVIYDNAEHFVIGGSKILKESKQDVACIIAAGITVFEALKAYEILLSQGIYVSIVDCYSIKPLDIDTLRTVLAASQKKAITVEDHYREGGLGEALCYALRNDDVYIEVLAVTKLPRSGGIDELLTYEEIDAHTIVQVVGRLCNRPEHEL